MRYSEQQMGSELLDQPPFDGEPKKLFICSTPRSGSYMLCRFMINAGLGVPHEYFNPIVMRQIAPRFGLGRDADRLAWRPPGRKDRLPFARLARAAEMAFTERYIKALVPGRCQSGIFAVKIQFEQYAAVLDNPVGWKLLDGGLFVYLYREDLLMQAISTRFAFATGKWSTDEAVTTAPQPDASLFDVTAIDRILEMLANGDRGWRLFFSRNGISPLFVSYEALCADPSGFVSRLAERLGCASAPFDERYAESGRHQASDPALPGKDDVARHYLAAVRRLDDVEHARHSSRTESRYAGSRSDRQVTAGLAPCREMTRSLPRPMTAGHPEICGRIRIEC